MTLSRRWRWAGAGLLALVVALVAVAPSWRSYYLLRGGVAITEDVPYVAGSADPRHRLDYYLPRQSPPGAGWPVVVFAHGGLWRPHHRRMYQPLSGLYGGVGVALARRGVATAVIDYRQHPEAASIDDALDDVARALRFVRDDVGARGGDPRRLYLVGHSAGGMLTAQLALSPEPLARAGLPPGAVRAFASLAAPYDQARMLGAFDAELQARARRLAGSDEGLARLSPERHVHAGHPPLLLLVGDGDARFLVEEQRAMARALATVGGDATALELQGEDHMDLVMHLHRHGDRAAAELLRFLDAHR